MEITRKSTPNQYALSGEVVAIVLHTTLGAYNGAVEWLMMSPGERQRRTGKKTYSSAHAVFGRLGQITTLAPFDRGTWHAGAVSKPSRRAKDVLPKHPWGSLKNPNKSTIGLEFASGYDIDKDGVLENWERLYSKQQIKAIAWFILNEIEPKTGKKFGDHNIITHQDITSYKPNLEKQRAMVVAELKKQRYEIENPKPKPTKPTPELVEPGSEVIITIEQGGKTIKYRGQAL